MDDLLSYITLDRCLDALGLVTGLLYLWWEYFANPKMWFAEMIMPVIMCWLFIDKGLYADFCMNLYYFVIAVYGYILWTKRRHKSDSNDGNATQLRITHIGLRRLFFCIAAFIAAYAIIAYWLLNFTDSTVPYADAFTTALSIVAMWMLAKKIIEQWIAWIIVDIVSAALYLYKDIPLSAFRYAVYVVIAFFGYAKWLRMMRQGK